MLALLLMISGVWVAPAHGQQSAVLESIVNLNSQSSDNQHTYLAATEDGRFLVCAWDGVVDGYRRIFIRESVYGVWLPERIVDAEPLAGNRSPVVAVDASGNIHVAWLGQVKGRDRVFYASLIGGQLVNWGPVDGGENADESCSKVVLRLDPSERPWLVWESGHGTHMNIRCSRLEDGVFKTDNLTPGAQTHNWFPDLFFTPDPVVVWYADQISEFALQAAQYRMDAGNWSPINLAGLDHLPKNALPQLLRRPAGNFVACWIEDISIDEKIPRTDFILVGEQGAGENSVARPVDFETTGTKESLARAIAGERIILSWCAKSLTEGWQIYLASGEQPPFAEKILITDGFREGYYDHPSVVAVPNGAAAVWHSSERFGGNGSVYFRQLRFIDSTP